MKKTRKGQTAGLPVTLSRILLTAFMASLLTVTIAMEFTPIRSINGLPNSEVRRMLIGKDGRLWIATTGGLCFYDGYCYRIYRNSAANPTLLSNNNIRCIAEDNSHHILIGTDKGLDILNQKTGEIIHSKLPQFRGQQIFDFFITKAGRTYVCLNNNTYIYDVDTDSAVELKYKNRSLRDAKMHEDRRGNIWIGTREILLRYSPVSRTYHEYSGFSGKNAVHIIVSDTKGRIWLGTFNSGITVMERPYDNTSASPITRISTEQGLQDCRIYSLAEDKTNGRMLVGTRSGLSEIAIQAPGHIVNHTPGGMNPMPFNEVDAIVGNESVMYVGTLGGGIYYVNLRKPLVGHNEMDEVVAQLSTNSVKSMAIADGKIWMGIGSYGLITYDLAKGQYAYSGDMPGLAEYTPMSTLMAIKKLSDGRMAMGSFFDGLYIWDGKNAKVYNASNTSWMKSDCIYSFAEDADGRLWIGTFKGLYLLEANGKGRMLKLRAAGHDLSANMFQTLHTSRDGYIWAGTKDAGLLRINPQNMQVDLFAISNDGIGCNDVECVTVDHNGNIWAGTDGGGLHLYRSGRFVSVNDIVGIPADVVYSILEDNTGRIWAGTNSGLLCLTPAKDIAKSVFRLYSSNNGASDNMFLRCSAFKGPDGTLYFGGHRGYIYFNPKKLSDMKRHTNAVITDIIIDGQSWYDMPMDLRNTISVNMPSFTSDITLNHDQNNFSIEFSAMNLHSPHNVKYSYMMDGYDTEWQMSGQFDHRANYNNMPPGHYRFLLRTMNSNGAWSDKIRTLDITITPPVWLRWYAYLIYVMVAAAAGWYVYRYAKHRIRQRVKAQFFTNVTNNMFKPLALVRGNIDYLSSRLPEYSKEFGEMKKNVEKQMSLISMEYKNQMSFEMKAVEIKDSEKDFIKRAVACVEQHISDEDYDVMAMADDMATSKTTLYNKLKQMTGMNISAFIRNVRLKAACRMLEKNPKARISDVAYNVGFGSPKYFSRCFKAEFGMLPKEYAEQFAEKKDSAGLTEGE